MKKQILLLGLILCVTIGAFAQQLTVPMNFVVNSPATVSGTYEYGYQADWGPTSIVTTCGDLAWGYTANGDSVGCTPIVTDLTGKIAMISRGACMFSLKVYHAQAAGAIGAVIVNVNTNPPDDIINMAGGDSMTAVTIPAVFVGYGTGSMLAAEMDANNTVNACFFVPSIDEARGLYNYAVPKDQIQTLESFEMEIFNNGLADETNVTAFVEITEPNGTVSTISESVGTVVSGTAPIELEFTGTYTPPAVTGRYTVKYSLTSDQGSYSGDTVLQYFDITDDIYRNDDNMGSITVPNPGTNFLTRYDIGNMYYPSSNAVATHASFVLRNAGYMHGETFDIILYDTESQGIDYVVGNYPVLGFTSLVIDSTIHGINDTIVVAIDALNGQNDLIADSSYLITVQYDALTNSGLVDPPAFGTSAGRQNMWASTNVLRLEQTVYSGWNGSEIILRLHLGFPINVNNVVMDELAAKVYPNPAQDFVTLDLNFDEVAQDVNVQMIDLQGRVIRTFNYNEIQEAKYTYDVSFLGAGNYFFRIQTENGFTTKHFIVIE